MLGQVLKVKSRKMKRDVHERRGVTEDYRAKMRENEQDPEM